MGLMKPVEDSLAFLQEDALLGSFPQAHKEIRIVLLVIVSQDLDNGISGLPGAIKGDP